MSDDMVTAPGTNAPPVPKSMLHGYLQQAREALLWKLDGICDYDARRPLTPTGSNLLGIVKHVASVELGYLGETFGRPSGIALPWFAQDAEPNADMWATAAESRDDIVGLYRSSWAHTDRVIEELPLDATGQVPWWSPERRTVTLEQILVHMIAETNRHVGHLDILREGLDGAAGLRADNDNLPHEDATWWTDYSERLEQEAAAFREEPGAPGAVQAERLRGVRLRGATSV